MVNTIWKENFLIMCSKLCLNARDSGHFAQLLLICRNYSLQTLCGAPHNVCNDEGLINGMPMNRAVERYGALAGPFFICGISGENFCSLTDAQVQKYRKMFLRPQIFLHTERGVGYLEYDNVTLPGAPQEAIDQFKKRNGLPEFCCCLLPGTEMPVLVRYGERSYVPLEVREPGERAEETAGRLNRQLGVTKQQQAAMLWGSMFGWDIPAADPARYDEQGMPKRHGPKHEDRQR